MDAGTGIEGVIVSWVDGHKETSDPYPPRLCLPEYDKNLVLPNRYTDGHSSHVVSPELEALAFKLLNSIQARDMSITRTPLLDGYELRFYRSALGWMGEVQIDYEKMEVQLFILEAIKYDPHGSGRFKVHSIQTGNYFTKSVYYHADPNGIKRCGEFISSYIHELYAHCDHELGVACG